MKLMKSTICDTMAMKLLYLSIQRLQIEFKKYLVVVGVLSIT